MAEAGAMKGKAPDKLSEAQTATKLATDYGVTSRTIERDGQFARAVGLPCKNHSPNLVEAGPATAAKRRVPDSFQSKKQRNIKTKNKRKQVQLIVAVYISYNFQLYNERFQKISCCHSSSLTS